jgi:uncharacterized membrane protein YphA (DoxX/SURF4 family)
MTPRRLVTEFAAPRRAAAVVRAGVAAVWLYEGLWRKLIRTDPAQVSIVAGVPGLPDRYAVAALRGIGVAETALGAWVLTGAAPRLAASAQTGLLCGMNAGGLLFAGQHIARPRRMLAGNAVLLAAAWSLAGQRERQP